jgi:hypothetical protein
MTENKPRYFQPNFNTKKGRWFQNVKSSYFNTYAEFYNVYRINYIL